ncbi:MAG: SulP family sulfate permease [Bacillariaceae sp.]
MTDTIKEILREKTEEGDLPIVVIVDFTLVIGMDSSAAHAIAKLKKIIHRLFHVETSIFCTGSDRDGFPCEFALSEALSPTPTNTTTDVSSNASASTHAKYDEENEMDLNDFQVLSPPGISNLSMRGAISISPHTASTMASEILATHMDGRVCETLDDALRFAEDILIARSDNTHEFHTYSCTVDEVSSINMTLEEEQYRAKTYLLGLFPESSSVEFLQLSADMIVSMMVREEYGKSDIIWDQGADSTSLKIVVSGELLSLIDESGASELVKIGSIVGELGLVHGTNRLTTLACSSPTAVVYSLDIVQWRNLQADYPKVASLVDAIVIRYLAHRVQHVSNRYFHTTLPV